ncbi:GSCFA domain-containing protein [Hydrotalea sp.]|uniref:GSCFA domain-containing protein n=1 Tax=Hydrotalea sp. TaxID=2881279 RepID=UPI00260190FB|nr:GSCFA domain-containing protein [Hydrotalea sp.]
MKFHAEFDIQKIDQPIHHRHKIMLIGSCFTENIGEKLSNTGFSVLQNPNGILFNPVSVAEAIINIIQQKIYIPSDLFCLNETWHSWQFHSRFSGITPEDAVQKINTSIQSAHQFLKNTDYLIITLGSAWVYTLTEQAANSQPGTIAANNHKAPSAWFQKKLMDITQIITVLGTMLDRLGVFNPNIKIIFTISPVRHLREGAINNNRSKSALISAVHYLTEQLPKLYYFPAYELVIDDLRDYRFYAEDLVHPNYAATEYVWTKLMEACMEPDTISLIKKMDEINLACRHKPFNPDTSQHQAFLKKYAALTQALLNEFPFLPLADTLQYFQQGIHH